MGAGGDDGQRQGRLSHAAGTRLALGALAWLAGIAAQLQQPALWPVWAYLALALAGAVFAGAAHAALARGGRAAGGTGTAVAAATHRRVAGTPATLVAAFAAGAVGAAALGFGWAGARAASRLSESLPSNLEGRTVVATGVVASLPQPGPDGTRFMFDVQSAQAEGRDMALPSRLSVGWYRNWHDESTLDDPSAGLAAGQQWRLPLRLKRPHGNLNPGGFDQELWLFEQGVRAGGYVRTSPSQPAVRLADAAGYPVQRWRQALRESIREHVADPRAAGVLAALSVGDQGAIERDDWELFRTSGVAHLMSISGLHVTMFAWLAAACIGTAWRRSARLMLWRPAPVAARWGGVAAAAAYAVFSGWGVPSQRTVWMLAAAAALSACGLQWPWLLVLLATAAIVALLDPWALLQVGFWLSFVAVALLMASGPGAVPSPDGPARGRALLGAAWRAARNGLRAQAIATLGLAPLTLVCFQQLSLVGFAANLVAIPLVTLVITPLALMGAVLPPLWTLGAWVAKALAACLAWLVAWPGAVWTVPAAPWWAQAAGLAAGALLLAPWPRRLRALALPLALPLLWPAVPRLPDGRFELLAADVGQGTAVLVRTRGHQLLYDTGPQYSRESDAGQRVLLPLLRRRGTQPLDLLMLSHSDLDHTGGAAAVVEHWPVRAMSSSLPASHPLLRHGVPHEPCHAGQSWAWDGVRFTVLHPRASDLAEAARPAKPNAVSCVLRIEDAAGQVALLAGDAEAQQEAAMLAADASLLRADVLLVPHHGSRTSSTAAFLDAAAPRIAVVQAGYRSRFGHPAPDVMARYAERGIEVVRSDRCGAWTWTPDESHCERDVARRYWQFVE